MVIFAVSVSGSKSLRDRGFLFASAPELLIVLHVAPAPSHWSITPPLFTPIVAFGATVEGGAEKLMFAVVALPCSSITPIHFPLFPDAQAGNVSALGPAVGLRHTMNP
jgi:hypothetical protein